jgi:F-type H+-transporting ATPase subunit b
MIAVTAPVIAVPAFQPPAQEAEATSEHASEGGGLVPMIAKLFNFALLAGVLVYFLRTPIAAYLAARGTQIRQDLVAAADMRAAASAQLADIQQKLQLLPAELEALTRRGAEDLRAEQARIADAARTERDRLLDQTRREIEMRLRIARRHITEYAAQLTIDVAEQRIKRSITPDDQLRLVDRYTAQLKEAR